MPHCASWRRCGLDETWLASGGAKEVGMKGWRERAAGIEPPDEVVEFSYAYPAELWYNT